MTKTIALLVAAAGAVLIPAAAFADESAPLTATATTTVQATTGHMLYAAGGRRLAPVYRVLADGSPQVILNGRLVTVPASTLTEADGKVATSLTIAQLSR